MKARMGRPDIMKRIQAMMPRRNGTRNLNGGHKTNAVPSRMSRD